MEGPPAGSSRPVAVHGGVQALPGQTQIGLPQLRWGVLVSVHPEGQLGGPPDTQSVPSLPQVPPGHGSVSSQPTRPSPFAKMPPHAWVSEQSLSTEQAPPSVSPLGRHVAPEIVDTPLLHPVAVKSQ